MVLMEETTTEVVTQETGATAQPEEQHAEAVLDTTSEPTSNDSQVEEPTQVENSHEEWLRNKGIDPADPEAMAKVAAMAQNAERAMHDKAQKASKLEKELGTVTQNGESEALARTQALEAKLATRDFFDAHPEAREQEEAMVDWITGDPVQREMVKQGLLTLDQVHAIVSASGSNTQAIKDQSRKETLEGLANKQRATGVQGAATTSAPAPQLTSANADTWWESLGADGRANPENRAKLDRLLS